jgi:hypothetical protein
MSSKGREKSGLVRPRWLFFTVFAWLACHGRFLGLFLAEYGLSDSEVGKSGFAA